MWKEYRNAWMSNIKHKGTPVTVLRAQLRKAIEFIDYYIARCALWKRAAKRWRDKAIQAHMAKLWKRVAKKWYAMYLDAEYCEEYFQSLATRRKELLRRVEKGSQYCPICRKTLSENWALFAGKKIAHATDCELARELEDTT